jgi:hypothetical protein
MEHRRIGVKKCEKSKEAQSSQIRLNDLSECARGGEAEKRFFQNQHEILELEGKNFRIFRDILTAQEGRMGSIREWIPSKTRKTQDIGSK